MNGTINVACPNLQITGYSTEYTITNAATGVINIGAACTNFYASGNMTNAGNINAPVPRKSLLEPILSKMALLRAMPAP